MSIDPPTSGDFTFPVEQSGEPPDEQRGKPQSHVGVRATMELSAETAIEIGFIREYFSLQTRAEAVALAASICALLLNEIKRGSSVLIQDKSGIQLKLVVGRKDDESKPTRSSRA